MNKGLAGKGSMNRRWFKFRSGADEELGFGTEEGAFAYAMLLNGDCEGEPCRPQPLNEAQSAGLIVLVTPRTFVIRDALEALRGRLIEG